jgi:hypothetical protein
MSSAIDSPVLSILTYHKSDIATLLHDHGLRSDDQREVFGSEVRHRFIDGIHHVYCDAILAFLENKYPTDEDIAKALEVDRTTISAIRKARRIAGKHITHFLSRFVSEFSPPSPESLHLGGCLTSVPYIRKSRIRDDNCDDDLTLEDLHCLFRSLLSESWREATRKPVGVTLDALGKSILAKVHAIVPKPWRVRSVPMLQQTIAEWFSPFLLCLWAVGGEP